MSKLRKAARGRECQIRIPGVCNHNPETVALAHYRMAGQNGTGIKPSDLLGAWACSECHRHVDGHGGISGHNRNMERLWHAEGVMRTLAQLEKEGLVKT